jgi:Rps23 Pro-64 3,4-dihydroxylase Tpa1-like proline 4-hydroxylase
VDSCVRRLPYKHVLLAPVLDPEPELQCLTLLESSRWIRNDGDFYNYDIPSSLDVRKQALEIIGLSACVRIREQLEAVFEIALQEPKEPNVHHYEAGCGIGVHTDGTVEEVRLVIGLNRTWSPDYGGIWILAADPALRTNTAYVPSLSNTGFAFRTSRQSFHALSRYRHGVGYAITLRLPLKG